MQLDPATISHLAANPGKDDLMVSDDARPGLWFRVRGGRAAWFIQWRDEGGKQRRLRVGTYPDLRLSAARDAAKRELAKVTTGSNPHVLRAAARERATHTLGAMADRYLKEAKLKLRARSYEEVERHLTKHWRSLRPLPIADVTLAQIADRLSEIKRVRGRVAAARARSSLSALFGFAMMEGRASTNPVLLTRKPLEESEIERDRVLSDADLVSIWSALRDDEYGDIVRLLALTGARRSEVGGIAWSEVDLDEATWLIPEKRAKNGTEHLVPLNASAVGILSRLHAREDRKKERDMVFGRRDGPFSGWTRAKAALDQRVASARAEAGDPAIEPWRLHDLRRTFATKLDEELGTMPFIVEALLNHAEAGDRRRGRVAKIYNRSKYLREKRQALDLWGDHLAAIVAGKPSNVVPLRAALRTGAS